MRRAVAVAVAALVAMLVVAGCGSSVRNHISDHYEFHDRRNGVETYHSPDPVGRTVAAIVARDRPVARAADGGFEYLRYNDDIVAVSAAPRGGSIITVEDLQDRYSSGGYSHLGPGFRPASPAAGYSSGGSGSAK